MIQPLLTLFFLLPLLSSGTNLNLSHTATSSSSLSIATASSTHGGQFEDLSLPSPPSIPRNLDKVAGKGLQQVVAKLPSDDDLVSSLLEMDSDHARDAHHHRHYSIRTNTDNNLNHDTNQSGNGIQGGVAPAFPRFQQLRSFDSSSASATIAKNSAARASGSSALEVEGRRLHSSSSSSTEAEAEADLEEGGDMLKVAMPDPCEKYCSHDKYSEFECQQCVMKGLVNGWIFRNSILG